MSDNYAKVKSRKYASDDDAENLLAGILDETEDVANAEQARIDAELRAKEDEDRRRKEAKDRAKKEEAAARLSAEMERLQKVEQRRTEKLEALKIEELKDRGEWIDPEIERKKLEAKIQEEAELAAMKQAAEEKARRKAQAVAQGEVSEAMGGPPQKSSNLALIGGIAVAVIGVVAAGAAVALGGYKIDQATYSKAVFAPKDQQVALIEKAFTPIPKPEPVVQEEEEAAPSHKSTSSRRRHSTRVASKSTKSKPTKPISTKPKQSEGNKAANELEKALNTDVFDGF